MNTSKLRDSTAIDRALAITAAVEKELKLEPADDGEEAPQDDKLLSSADSAAMILRRISASGEIDALVNDLQILREKLVDDRTRVEKSIVAYTTLNQSVMQLTKLIADSIAQVKAPKAAE